MAAPDRRLSMPVSPDRTYLKCIRDYQWKFDDQICGSGRCGDVYLPLKRIDDEWYKALEIETRRPTIVPAAFVKKFSGDGGELRSRFNSRASAAYEKIAEEGNTESETNVCELTPPSLQELKAFLTRSSSIDYSAGRRAAFHRSSTVDESRGPVSSKLSNIHENRAESASSAKSDRFRDSAIENDYENIPANAKNAITASSGAKHALSSRASLPSLGAYKSLEIPDADLPRRTAPSPPSVPPAPLRKQLSRQSASFSASDLPGERTRIRELLRGFFAKRVSSDALKQRGILKDEPIFGALSILQICECEQSRVPNFVEFCIRAIELRNGWLEEGIYRLSGSTASIQKLRVAVNALPVASFSSTKPEAPSNTPPAPLRAPKPIPRAKPNVPKQNVEAKGITLAGFEPYSLIADQLKCGVHELTGSLKLFFRELQQPLFTADEAVLTTLQQLGELTANFEQQKGQNACNDTVDANSNSNGDSKGEVLRLLKQIVRSPAYAPVLSTVSRLFIHLEKVASHETVNKMNTFNLALVFTPNLFPQSLSLNTSLTYVTAALIQNAAFIFES